MHQEFCETSKTVYQLTRRHIAEDFSLYEHCYENAQPHKRKSSFAKNPKQTKFCVIRN